MEPRNLELATEFCDLVGKSNLLEYLGLPEDTGADDAKTKLKARRRYMQGMQSNPKYKKEALFLIKHYSALESVLADPTAHLKDISRRKESTHLPILEMTIQGVLKGGSLSAEQEDYLRRNAVELGVSEATFEEILDRLAKDAGVARPGGGAAPIADDTGPPAKRRDDEPSVPRSPLASEANTAPPVRRALIPNPSETDSDVDPPTAPRPAPITPGPPIKAPAPINPVPQPSNPPISQLGTVPAPVRRMKLEVVGEPFRRLAVYARPVTTEVRVRNTGSTPWSGRISTDEGWLIANPSRLDPGVREQVITVRIDPRDMFEPSARGNLAIQTDTGERTTVTFEVSRKFNIVPIVVAGASVVALLAFLVIAAIAYQVWRSQSPAAALTITVDPSATTILLNGQKVGSGSQVTIPQPPAGEVRISVIETNYLPHEQVVTLEPGRTTMVPIRLELRQPMTFRPEEGLRKAHLGQGADKKIPTRALDECVKQLGRESEGIVRIHVGRDGKASGVEIEGDAVQDRAVEECIVRHAATVAFPALQDGDYATVRYEFKVDKPGNGE